MNNAQICQRKQLSRIMNAEHISADAGGPWFHRRYVMVILPFHEDTQLYT